MKKLMGFHRGESRGLDRVVGCRSTVGPAGASQTEEISGLIPAVRLVRSLVDRDPAYRSQNVDFSRLLVGWLWSWNFGISYDDFVN
jgi:hypothetical protein